MADEKKCKYCSMMIPAKAIFCPCCRESTADTSLKSQMKVLLVLAFCGFIIFFFFFYPKMNYGNLPSGAIYAKDLHKEYKANEVAADLKYKDKTIRVYGRVDSIDKMINFMFVTLKGKLFETYHVQCEFDNKDEINKIASLEKGEKIVIEGKCHGLSMFAGVQLLDCKIIR